MEGAGIRVALRVERIRVHDRADAKPTKASVAFTVQRRVGRAVISLALPAPRRDVSSLVPKRPDGLACCYGVARSFGRPDGSDGSALRRA
jgi:hypothetical protein